MPIVHSADSAWAYEPGVRLLARGTHGIPHIHTIVRSAQTTIPGCRDGKSKQGSTSHIFWPIFFKIFLSAKSKVNSQCFVTAWLPTRKRASGKVWCALCIVIPQSTIWLFLSGTLSVKDSCVGILGSLQSSKCLNRGVGSTKFFFIRPRSLSYYLQSPAVLKYKS